MNLLLLEDDLDLGQAVADHLRAAGHGVRWCRTLQQARQEVDEFDPGLALLDLRLPDGDGLDLLRQWRGAGHGWPVIVMTARDQVSECIVGLRSGADDFLVKPFDLHELAARVDAVTRRSAGSRAALDGGGDAGLRLDLDRRTVWLHDRRVDLTQMEWAVLACLARRPGRIYSRTEIEARLQTNDLADGASNSIEVIVSRLRKKVGASAISTHRGLGYRLEP